MRKKYLPEENSAITEKDMLTTYLWDLLEERTLAEGHALILKLQTKTANSNEENKAIAFIVLRLWVDKLWEENEKKGEKKSVWNRESLEQINLEELTEFYKKNWSTIENTLFEILTGKKKDDPNSEEAMQKWKEDSKNESQEHQKADEGLETMDL